MVGATQVMGWVGVGWGGDGNVPCTCTHGRDGIEHRNVLAVHHINQRPGLATVLDALKKHRSLASRSFLSPSQVFKQPLWQV